MNPALIRVATELGVVVEPELTEKWSLLSDWLREEAAVAGGIGPAEADRIEERHLADSLEFSAPFPTPPSECWDLGTGVGLPGLVLATIWPQTRMVLVDSSSRRCDLARRAARVIDVEVEVRQARIEEISGPLRAIVSRATIPAELFRPLLRRLLAPGGKAVISAAGVVPPGFEPVTILDRATRLLMMQAP